MQMIEILQISYHSPNHAKVILDLTLTTSPIDGSPVCPWRHAERLFQSGGPPNNRGLVFLGIKYRSELGERHDLNDETKDSSAPRL